MALEYRHDPDLEFLGSLDGDALDPLVEILTKDKDGNSRLNENLTSESLYKEHAPNHAKYWRLVAAELQTWHGNALWNRVRGSGDKLGVPYRDILCDVCDKMKVSYNKDSNTEIIEAYLCQKVLTDVMEKMTPQQIKGLVEELNLRTANFTPQTVAAAVMVLVRSSGFLPYKIAVIVANAVFNAVFKRLIGSGLSLAANAALTRSIGVLTGPVGWTITALWAAYDLAGPAYRVTVPAVTMIACLRAQWRHDTESPNEATE